MFVSCVLCRCGIRWAQVWDETLLVHDAGDRFVVCEL